MDPKAIGPGAFTVAPDQPVRPFLHIDTLWKIAGKNIHYFSFDCMKMEEGFKLYKQNHNLLM